MSETPSMIEQLTQPCNRDPFHHRWREEYYGWKCEFCDQFIPFGCEPWAPDIEPEIIA